MKKNLLKTLKSFTCLSFLALALNVSTARAQVFIMTPGGSDATCSGNFYDSGNIGGTYLDNENATHTICPSTPGAMLQVNFTFFDLESGYDYLSIYNGPSTASPLIGTYDATSPGTVTSTDASGCLTFVFTSDGSVTYSGWEATLSCIGGSPTTIIMTPGGSDATCSADFYDSGNIGGTYSNFENATHTICPSTPGAMLQANFTFFDLESGYDYLTIYNGPSTASPLIGTYDAFSPGTVTSTDPSGCLTFVFTSDGSVTYSGWEATLSCIPPAATDIIITPGGSDATCSANFYDSGNIGGTYSNGENSTHTICPSTPGAMLQADFTFFDLEAGWDYLSIYDGPSTASPLIGTYDATSPGTVTSTDPSGCLTFVFTSDGSVTYNGWEATLSCIPPAATDIIITPGGSDATCSANFYDSGNIGGTYSNFENATHTICPSTPGAMLQADFTFFDLEAGWDYLSIYDGPSTASPLIGTYDATSPGTVTSTDPSGCLTFVFTSDGSVTYNGWEATLSCIPPAATDIIITPGGSDATCSANFYDSGNIGGTYSNFENSTHTICPSTPGAMLQADFTFFDLEAGWDYLSIYNGPSTASPLIGTYDATSPGTVTSTDPSGCLTFVFTSDGSVTYSGWEATLSCIPPAVTDIIMTPGGSDATCSASFYDSGNIGGTYSNFENSTHTICPSTPGAMLQADFTFFDLEAGWDYLSIYNGPSTASPLIGTYDATSPGTVTSTDPSGCLTFVFTSDGSVTYSGWEASLSCVPPIPCVEPDVPVLSANPLAVCQGALSTISISGNLNDATAWYVYEASCGGTSIGSTATSTFDVNPAVTTTYYVRGEGGCTSAATCQSITITVEDVTAPVADVVSLTDASGECSVTPTAPTATDNCIGAITGTPDVAFPVTTLGTTVVTWTYDDGNGNSTTQTQNVVVTDNTAPLADVVSLTDATGDCSVTPTAPTATDNCMGSVTGTPDVAFPVTTPGTTVVTWTYDDGNGNVSTQTQNVVVTDNTAPLADMVSLADETGICSVTPTAPTATDNCMGSVTGTPDVAFPITTLGTTVVTWTYDDGNGNTSTQTQNVIVDNADVTVAQAGSQLSANASPASYQWIDCDNGNIAIAGETNQTFTATLTGNYAVIVTQNGCTDTSACILVDLTGLDELTSGIDFTVHPNPGSGLFEVTISGMMTERAVLKVCNAVGQTVYTTATFADINNQELIFDLSAHAPGVYVVHILGENGTRLMERIVKL